MNDMELITYTDAAAFLRLARAPLEREEAIHNVMLGVALRLVGNPAFYGGEPAYLATVSEGEGLVAAALMTPPHNLLVYGAGVPDRCGAALGLIARDLQRSGRRVPGVLGPAPYSRFFAEAWCVAAGRSFRPGMRHRVYELREVLPVPVSPGALRVAGEADLPLLARWLAQFVVDAHMEDRPPDKKETAQRLIADGDAFLWQDGQPVSLAARSRRLPHGIAVGPVYTPAALRGRGYATSCVAALSRRLLADGWEYCCLHADLANPTSTSIYQKIGYRPLCEFEEYILDRE